MSGNGGLFRRIISPCGVVVMPITLGCPSCAKRFKARDESAGKKVKCPYCQVPVQVPTSEESARAGAPTAPLPTGAAPRPAPPPRPASPPASAPVVASPDDWGALPSAPAASSPPPPASPPPADNAPFPVLSPPSAPGRGGKDRPKPAKDDKADKADKGGKGD